MKTKRVIRKILAALIIAIAGANAADYIYASNAAVNATTTTCGELDANGICMSANIASSATVTIDGLVNGKAEIEVLPSSRGTLNNTDLSVTAFTNSDLGYSVSAIIDNGQTDKTTLVHESDTSKVIASIESEIPAADFEAAVAPAAARNRWGISVDGGSYKPISASMTLKSATGATGKDGEATDIRLGARVDLESGFAGKYSTTLNFIVTANITP